MEAERRATVMAEAEDEDGDRNKEGRNTTKLKPPAATAEELAASETDGELTEAAEPDSRAVA